MLGAFQLKSRPRATCHNSSYGHKEPHMRNMWKKILFKNRDEGAYEVAQ